MTRLYLVLAAFASCDALTLLRAAPRVAHARAPAASMLFGGGGGEGEGGMPNMMETSKMRPHSPSQGHGARARGPVC